jgi:N-formylglutamate deformylase
MPPIEVAAPENPVRLQRAIGAASAIPLVLDSPHSGTAYPEDFRAMQPVAALRTAEDTHVDALFSHAPKVGATLISAAFPRCYVDCNRTVGDIDASMLSAAWPHAVNVSEKTRLGYGLIWRRLDDGSMIYDRQLSVEEVQARIEHCYAPYWKALRDEVELMREAFGVAYHLNCHSMPSHATHASHLALGTAHADVVLGDRDGSTAEPAFVDCIEHAFRRAGLRVVRNDPYKGVALVEAFGTPSSHSHSVQIEINRSLYMNESTRAPNDNFAATQQAVGVMLQDVARWIAQRAAAARCAV